jgi:hypothetical protein
VEKFVSDYAVIKANHVMNEVDSSGFVLYCNKTYYLQYVSETGDYVPQEQFLYWIATALSGAEQGRVYSVELTLERFGVALGSQTLEVMDFALLKVGGDRRLCMVRI